MIWKMLRVAAEAKELLKEGGDYRTVAKSFGLTAPTLKHYIAVSELDPELLQANRTEAISDTALTKIARLSAEGQRKALEILRAKGRITHHYLNEIAEGEGPTRKRFVAAARALLKNGYSVEELTAIIAKIPLDR